MKNSLSRRDVLAGSLAAGLTAALSTSAAARGKGSPTQGLGDPSVLAPPSTSSTLATRFFATIAPPAIYNPGISYTVKVVKLEFAPSASQMAVTWTDTNLNGISGGSFQTQITFPALSPPISVAIPVEPMSGSESEVYAIVVMNSTNSSMTTFVLTP